MNIIISLVLKRTLIKQHIVTDAICAVAAHVVVQCNTLSMLLLWQ